MNKQISNIIKEWKNEAGVKGIIQVSFRTPSHGIIKICTNRPGWMIGPHGSLYEKYKKMLQEINHNLEDIEFIETDSWYIR